MLDETEVRQVVLATIKELKRENLLRDAEGLAYKEISERLQRFYAPFNSSADADLENALEALKDDRYRHILWMFYRDGYTVEDIAERLNVDVRTVTRNKKRLCLDLFNRLNS